MVNNNINNKYMLLLILGIIISIIYIIFFLPKKSGLEPYINPTIYPIMYKGMLVIPYSSKKAIHIHHWVIYLFICILNIFKKVPEIILGISTGLFIHGIQYKDSFKFITNNPYK